MIKLLIICEGETDQTLLGQYIEGVSDWKYFSKIKNPPFNSKNIVWYKNTSPQGELLGIWQNGGCDFDKTIQKVCERELFEHCVERIIVVTDHDEIISEKERLHSIQNVIRTELKSELPLWNEVNQWYDIKYRNLFDENTGFKLGYLLIPKEEEGALETFMLRALSENQVENKNVINQVKIFISKFNSDIYLKKRRDRVKAELGVSLSIFAPDKSFRAISEIIQSVNWNEFVESDKQFKMIKESL